MFLPLTVVLRKDLTRVPVVGGAEASTEGEVCPEIDLKVQESGIMTHSAIVAGKKATSEYTA